MDIKILGCYGAEMPGYRTTCFQLNSSTFVDGGAITSVLSQSEQTRIRNILLTHAHMDHVKDIPLLSDNVIGCIDEPINIISTAEIIASLKKHLFNNHIWPDFTKIPSIEHPVIKFCEITAEVPFKVSNFNITAVEVNHTVPTVGYIISDDKSSLAISGDTSVTERLWEVINSTENMKGIFLETSFPNSMRELAEMSGHLTPEMANNEAKKLKDNNIPIYLYHLKPNFLDVLKSEISSISDFTVSILEQDRSYTF